jgi:hypothetical protein
MRLTVVCAILCTTLLLVASSSSTAAPRPQKSLDAARLAGDFNVVVRVIRKSNFGGHPGSTARRMWSFVPLCPRGACKTRAVMVLLDDSFSAKPRMELTRRGRVYEGRGSGVVGECFIQPVRGKIEVRLRVGGAKWIGTHWRATRWWGTILIEAPTFSNGTVRCAAGSLSADVSGTLVTG